MSQAGQFLRRTKDGFAHWCPGCEEVHTYRTDGEPAHPKWTFNGNPEKPSFTPSMLIRWGNKVPGYEAKYKNGGACHYFITDGKIIYCGDCTHALVGKTADLPVWPYPAGAYGGLVE